jgi:3-deoxy-manno-octulosonate cytidylyltransferase (CMP-KDO synthetase)
LSFHVIIPARLDSTRLPQKALADIHGQTLVERVYHCALASNAASVTVATDDDRIAQVIRGTGGKACMTGRSHRSGTDRIAEAIRALELADDAIVVNLQGDEPLMPAAVINQVARTLADNKTAAMATACHPIETVQDFLDPNVVKVVRDHDNLALYFSRAPIPWQRASAGRPSTVPTGILRHVGIYAYRAGFVQQFSQWPPCEVERAEALEQLRPMHYGHRIAVCETAQRPGPGVDTPEDLERVRKLFAGQ